MKLRRLVAMLLPAAIACGTEPDDAFSGIFRLVECEGFSTLPAHPPPCAFGTPHITYYIDSLVVSFGTDGTVMWHEGHRSYFHPQGGPTTDSSAVVIASAGTFARVRDTLLIALAGARTRTGVRKGAHAVSVNLHPDNYEFPKGLLVRQ